MSATRTDVTKREHHALRKLTLNSQAELFRVGQLVSEAVSGREGDRQVCRPYSRRSRWRNGKREAVSYRISLTHTSLIGLLDIDRRWTHPEQSEGRIADLVEQSQVLDGGIVDSATGSDARFAWTAKEL